jgi:integrase
MNSACGKVLGDFARSVLHHHRAVADQGHAIFGDEHGAEQDPGIRPDADRSTHHRGGRHAGAGSTRGVSPCRPPAGITKNVGPHTLRHAFITAALDAGVPLRDVQEAASHADPRTTMRYDRARTSLDRHAPYIVAAYVAGVPQ